MIKSLTSLTTLDHPGLDLYRTLKRPLEHREQGLFVAEGHTVVERFLASSVTAVSALMTPVWFDRFRERLEARPDPIDVYIGESKLLESIVTFSIHQGVMAAGRVPVPVSLYEVVAASVFPRLFAAVEGLTSAENTGVLVRNCAGCGAGAFIRGETSADPWLRRAVRNSMGTIFRLPVIETGSLTDTLTQLRHKYGFRIYAAHPHRGSLNLFDVDFRRDSCVVFGSEGEGVSEQVLSVCDAPVAIPMENDVDSLNVACASAILFYEALRQRRTRG